MLGKKAQAMTLSHNLEWKYRKARQVGNICCIFTKKKNVPVYFNFILNEAVYDMRIYDNQQKIVK